MHSSFFETVKFGAKTPQSDTQKKMYCRNSFILFILHDFSCPYFNCEGSKFRKENKRNFTININIKSIYGRCHLWLTTQPYKESLEVMTRYCNKYSKIFYKPHKRLLCKKNKLEMRYFNKTTVSYIRKQINFMDEGHNLYEF